MTSNPDRTAEDAYLMNEARWTRTYPAGRRCGTCGCATILSRYNPDAFCAQHRPKNTSLRYHGMSFKLCIECGTVIQVRNNNGGRCGACGGHGRK